MDNSGLYREMKCPMVAHLSSAQPGARKWSCVIVDHDVSLQKKKSNETIQTRVLSEY